jgi:hypothetical protein
MPGIYKHSHFKSDIWGHGGNKRTAQINHLLLNAGLTFTEADFSAYAPAAKNILHYFKGLSFSGNISNGFKNNYAIGRYLKQFEAFIKQHRPDYFIWESTNAFNLLLAGVLHNFQIPFVALPHNIESLVQGSESIFSQKTSPHWLTEELSYLKHANHVFTISREEQWLLATHHIEASYLPYYPPAELKNSLLNIRDKRIEYKTNDQQRKKQLLLLGTFYNAPTYNGYMRLINQIKHLNNIEINVVGSGSEQLRKIFPQENIKIWGTVSTAQLHELLITCHQALVHQEPTSGALTRIPELLLAGVPILANTVAARSYYDLNGITIYHDTDQLIDLINMETKPMPPLVPQPIEEEYFIKYIVANARQ